jgi:hypothetical protein
MILMILEPLIVNDENLDMLLKTNSLEGIGRLILLQRVAADIDGWVNGETVAAVGDKNLITYEKRLENETLVDEEGKVLPMKSFRYILRIMASAARKKTGVTILVKDPVFLSKLLLFAEDLQSEETVANCLKIFRIGLEDDDLVDTIFNRYPNILNFMLYQMERWLGSTAVMGECVLGIRCSIEERRNLGILRPESVAGFVSNITKNKRAMKDNHILQLLRAFSRHPEYG